MPNDRTQLIHHAKLGNQQATAELLGGYRNYLRLIAQMQIHPGLQAKTDASDLVQETCLAACRDFREFRGQTEPELLAWLRRIMANKNLKVARHYYAQRRDVHLEQDLAADLDRSAAALSGLVSPVSTPSQGVLRREATVILADKLAELPEHYREALVLRYLKGMTIAQVAEHLHRSSQATNSLLARSLLALRKKMKDAR